MGPTVYFPPIELVSFVLALIVAVAGGTWTIFRLRAGDKASLSKLINEAVDSINERLDKLTDKVGNQNGRVTRAEVMIDELRADKIDMFGALNEIRDFLLSTKAGIVTKRRKQL